MFNQTLSAPPPGACAISLVLGVVAAVVLDVVAGAGVAAGAALDGLEVAGVSVVVAAPLPLVLPLSGVPYHSFTLMATAGALF